MQLLRFCIAAAVGGACAAAGAQGWAQAYPSKTVRLIVPSSAGSGFDVIGRIVAGGLGEVFGQQVIVDNRAGANGNIGAELASKAPPDGYTLLLAAASHTANVIIYRNQQFDFVRDFAPVTLLTSSPSVVVVHPSLPVKSIGDLVKLAKARPGKLDYASTGVGSTTYIGAEMFKMMADVNIVHVPYRGGGEALTAVVSGEVPIYFPPIAPALPHMQAGRLRTLAVTSAKRLQLIPQYPTVAESGFPKFEFGSWNGISVPAKTPREVISRIHGAATTALRNPAAVKRMTELGYIVIGNQPEEFAAFIKSEIDSLGQILRDLRGTAE
jgi:tripartite-type tricarboxylate transporter receptor subunit TctC